MCAVKFKQRTLYICLMMGLGRGSVPCLTQVSSYSLPLAIGEHIFNYISLETMPLPP